MKLKTEHKKIKEKAPKKQETAVKRVRGEKVRKDFNSHNKYRAEIGTIDLTQLTYGVIEGHEVKSLNTSDGKISIEGSWEGLIIFLLDVVISEYPDTYRDKLLENDVASTTLVVDSKYGVYTFDKDKQYRVYSIYDTGVYIESLFSSSDIFQALVGLARICKIPLKEFKMNIVSKEYIERKLNFDLLVPGEIIVGIGDLLDRLEHNYILTEISIMNDRIELNDLGLVLWLFCKHILDVYGRDAVLKLPKHKNAGIVKDCNTDREIYYQELAGTGLYVYTNREDKDIVKFINASIEKLGIPENTVKFKLKQLITQVPQDPYLYEQYELLRNRQKMEGKSEKNSKNL